MRRLILPALCLATLALTGCDSTEAPASDAGVNLDAPVDIADAPPPACPFTAAQASELVGEPLVDQGNCLFGDGKGVASLTVTTASRTAGEMTYDYQREQADQIYRQVTDLDLDGKGYLAVKDIEAQAVRIDDGGTYTMTLSSFARLGGSPDGYEQALRRLLDALPR
ncbi:hypothetical protein ABTX15_06410 [Micromonospora sp. NPDC094482]|uniref:hypothetical protein n=1 Tax=unclassified Micromonospora TaxID=2617518 RepID=UPI00331B9CB2